MVSETDRLFLFGLVAALLPVIVFVFSLVSVLLGAPFILIGTPYVFMSPVGLLFWGVVMVLVWAWASQKEHSHATGVGLIMGGAITALFFLAFIMLTILSVLP